MPWGYWEKGTQYTPYGPQPMARWVRDPNGPIWRNPPFWEEPAFKVSCLVLLSLIAVASLVVLFGFNWFRNNVAPPNEFNVGSSWQGQEYQYDIRDTTHMSLHVDSLKNKAFTATVSWPNLHTVTVARGSVVTNINDKHWKYITHPDRKYFGNGHCLKGAVYLQFTETAYKQGSSVALNTTYYGEACYKEISGVWFSTNEPNAVPGGEFNLIKK